MAERESTPVAIGILLDDERPGRLWLLRRPDYNEWQLPGKKIAEGQLAAEALRQSLEVKLGVSPAGIEHLASLPPIPQGEVVYEAECFEVTGYAFDPRLVDHDMYAQAQAVYPLSRNLGRLTLSPITRYVFDAFVRGTRGEPDGILLRHNNPIQ